MFKEMKLKQGYQSKINVHTRNNRIRSKWIPQKLGEPQTDDKIKVWVEERKREENDF